MTVIATSTAATATAYANQRKIDRCSDGTLVALLDIGDSPPYLYPIYSKDNGQTWALVSGDSRVYVYNNNSTRNYTLNHSMFIDLDDYIHVVYKNVQDGFIYYRRGTPNAARTAWTWSAAVQASSGSSSDNYPDVVAHREGTGWVAHVIGSQVFSSNTFTWYTPMTITSGGSITKGTTSFIGNGGSGYPSTTPTYPSIDFNHTGDGKTVAGSTPHLYAAWSAGAVGAGKGIRFKKALYNAGAWTWGTEREIDPNVYVNGNYWLNCLFDGTQVIIGALPSGDVDPDLKLYERDAADTNTVVRTLLSNVITGTPANALLSGSMTYDGDGNVYFFGADYTGTTTTRKINWRMWDRASQAIGPLNTIETSGMNSPYMSAKRGHSGRRVEFIYTDGTASPYSVTYDSIDLNTLPTKPTLVTVVSPAVAGQGADASWQYNDPDGDPQAKWKYRLRKV